MVVGYNQIEMAKDDKAKTVFSSKEGHWEYKRVHFGLKTGTCRLPESFECGTEWPHGVAFFFVFFNDIVVYAKSLADHGAEIRQVFDRRRESNVKFKPEKCEISSEGG
jgi:hypothetical protein